MALPSESTLYLTRDPKIAKRDNHSTRNVKQLFHTVIINN